MNPLAPLPSAFTVPVLVAAAGDKASKRFLEFFAATIRNTHTRRAYSRAVTEFMAWCHQHGLESLIDIEPLHVATWIEAQVKAGCAAPSVKQRLAALRHLLDWLVVGQIVPTNPAASVHAALLGHAARGVTQGYVHIDEALKLAATRTCEEIASLLASGRDDAATARKKAA